MLTWHSISRKRSGGNVWLSKLRAAHKNVICLALFHVTVSATWDRPGNVYICVNGTQSSLMEALSGSSWGESSRPELLGRLITAISKLTKGKEHPDLIRAGSCQECCHQSGHCHPHRPRKRIHLSESSTITRCRMARQSAHNNKWKCQTVIHTKSHTAFFLNLPDRVCVSVVLCLFF